MAPTNKRNILLYYLIVKYDANYLIFGGDLNTDMSRNNCQTKLLSDLYK